MITLKQTSAATAQGVPPNAPESSTSAENLLDYQVAVEKIRQLKQIAGSVEAEANTRRDLRHITVDVAQEKSGNKLQPDEIYVPVRLADQNIRREQGKYVAYIKQPQRTAFFYPVDNPSLSTELLAADFTKRSRFQKWDLPIYRTIDRFQTHGYAVMEVQYDQSKPGRFYNDDVPFEDFLAPEDFREVQTCEMIGRTYHKTKTQLLELVQRSGFDPAQVDKITGSDGEVKDQSITLYRIEKMFFRVGGVVHVAWNAEACDGWLREPRPFHNGVVDQRQQPLFETEYPFVLFPYQISENQRIGELKGRVFLDEYQQEAATSLQSSYCTAHRRSSAPYFTRDDDNPGGEVAKNVTITPGAIIDAKVKPFQLTPPDPSMLSAIQALVTQSLQDGGNINYAANNRVDSRKTATEIQSAQTENALLATTQTALFSTAMAELLTMNFRIFASHVAAGLLTSPVPVQLYTMTYVITPGGDIEVVARQEKLNNMKQSWPVVQNTPIAMEFLKRMLSLMFPEDAPIYNAMFVEDQAKTQLVQKLWQFVQALAISPETGQLEPAMEPFAAEFQMLGQEVAQVVNGGVQAGAMPGPSGPSGPSEQPAPQSEQQAPAPQPG